MDTILQGIPGVMCYIYDILVLGDSNIERFQRLDEVLHHLQAHGIRMKCLKCPFFQNIMKILREIELMQKQYESYQQRCNRKGSSATNHRAVAIIFRTTELLSEVPAKLGYHPPSSP